VQHKFVLEECSLFSNVRWQQVEVLGLGDSAMEVDKDFNTKTYLKMANETYRCCQSVKQI